MAPDSARDGENRPVDNLRARIARALWAADPPFTEFPWDDAEDSDEDKTYFLGLADAALADLGIEQVGWEWRYDPEWVAEQPGVNGDWHPLVDSVGRWRVVLPQMKHLRPVYAMDANGSTHADGAA